jgi:hypothetical protein
VWLTVVKRISECNVKRRTAPRATAALLWFITRDAMVAGVLQQQLGSEASLHLQRYKTVVVLWDLSHCPSFD